MNVKEKALKLLSRRKKITSNELAKASGVSRQYASIVLRGLAQEGKLEKIGFTKSSFYVKPGFRELLQEDIKRRLQNKSLDEDEVLDSLKQQASFIGGLHGNIVRIFDYAFTEMLNNAIDHSKSKFIEIRIGHEGSNTWFIVDDFGIGVFKNVMEKRGLNSELEAMQDLLKGKTTTHPQAHTGEGIFFTSKVADVFILESFGLRLRIDNLVDDIFIEEVAPSREGTRVIFQINKNSKKEVDDIFKKYQVDTMEPGFDRTEIKIKLYTMQTEYISRSQARRLLAGLDKFKSIVLDFDKVKTAGQGFADQIFRVFQERHPNIKITVINTNEVVQFTIDRAKAETPDAEHP